MDRVLFISNYLYGESCGSKTCAYAHWDVLRKAYGKDNVFTMALVGKEGSFIPIEEENFYIKTVSGHFTHRLFNFIVGYTGKINEHIVKDIVAIIRKNNISIVFFDDSIYGKAIKRLKKYNLNCRYITYYQDVKRNLCKYWIKKDIKKTPVYLQLMLNEYLAQKYSDFNLLLNDREVREYKKYYHKNPEMLFPVVMSVPSIPEKIEEKSHFFEILFVGGYYFPNVNGIDWFIKEVFSKLKGDYKLTIIGNNMDKLQNLYVNIDNVVIKGHVDDLSTYYNVADVIVGPIFEGAGMKVKTAEAFSYGKCFVGTDESLEGYIENVSTDLTNHYIYQCNTAEEFINVLNYMNLKKSIKKYNPEVRLFFEENYSIDVVAEKLTNVLHKE